MTGILKLLMLCLGIYGGILLWSERTPSPAPAARTAPAASTRTQPPAVPMSNRFLEPHRRRAVAGAAQDRAIYMKKLSEILAELRGKESKLQRMMDDAGNESLHAVTGVGGIRTGNPLQSREQNVARIAGDLASAQRAREEVEAEVDRWRSFLENQ